MKIIVTIPAYNEAKTIGVLIRKINRVMKKNRYRYEIIVVDDCSTDETASIAKKSGVKVYSHPRKLGLAEVFRTEIEKTLEKKADVIVHIDADLQYRPEEIPKLLNPVLKKQADLVLGSRFLGTIEEMPWLRKWGNKRFSKIISNIVGFKITDGQTGFRAFTRAVAEKIRIKSTHTYTQEMIIRAAKEKFRIMEVPVYFAKRKSGKSRLLSNSLEFAVKAWVNILRTYIDYEPLKFFGRIGMVFFILGMILGGTVLYEFVASGFTELIDQRIPTMILSAIFILGGLQIILFGFLGDKIARG